MNGLSPAELLVAVGLVGLLVVILLARRGRTNRAPSPGLPVGPLSRSQLEAIPGFAPERARDYAPDPQAVQRIAAEKGDLSLVVFVGTWCPDSVREVPRLWRVLDAAGVPDERVRLIGVDRAKQDPAGLARVHRLDRVPTIVALRGERELGRITERPLDTLERDLAQILAQTQAQGADALPSSPLKEAEPR